MFWSGDTERSSACFAKQSPIPGQLVGPGASRVSVANEAERRRGNCRGTRQWGENPPRLRSNPSRRGFSTELCSGARRLASSFDRREPGGSGGRSPPHTEQAQRGGRVTCYPTDEMGLFCTIQAGEAGPFSRIWQEQQLEMKFYEQISYFKSFESKNEETNLTEL